MVKNELNFKKEETTIMLALSECLEMLKFIARHSFDEETSCFLKNLFMNLRHLSYYLSNKKSHLIRYKDKLQENDLFIINKIINTRNASAHPNDKQHWLNDYIMISGGMNFKEKDVEIQYGNNKLFLIKEIIYIYKKFREIFSQTSELSYIDEHTYWKHEEQELIRIEQEITKLLEDTTKLIKDRLNYR